MHLRDVAVGLAAAMPFVFAFLLAKATRDDGEPVAHWARRQALELGIMSVVSWTLALGLALHDRIRWDLGPPF